MANECDEELPRYTTVERVIEEEGSDPQFGVLDREEPEIAWFGGSSHSDTLVQQWEGWLNSGEKPRDRLVWEPDEERS